MVNSRNRMVAGVHGLFWAAVPMLAGWLLLFCAAELAQLVGQALGLEAKLLSQIVGAAAQMKRARFLLPWVAMVLVGAGFGGLRLVSVRRKWSRIGFVVLEVVAFLPVMIGLLWLTEINDVQFGTLITTYLPILREVL